LIARVSDSVPVYQKTAEGIAEFVKRAAKSLNFQDLLISNAHEGRDELTGLKNRRSLTHRLEQLDKRGYEDYLPASVIIVDIDYFKAVNDVYGHNAGDEVLYQVAEFLVSHMGESNTYRLGGEEFCIVMEGYTPEEVQERFEKLKKDIAEKGFDTGKGQRIYKTASVGICSLPDPESAESMRGNNRDWTKDAIDRADKCLYLAKRHGRNRIVSCNELDCIDSVMALFIKSEGISEDASGLDAAAAKERIIASLKREYSKRDLVEHSKVQAIIDSNAQSCIKVFDDAITYCIDTPKIADKDDFGRFFRNLVLDMFSMYRRHIPYAVGNEFDASKAETAISEELSGMPDNFDKVFKRRVATKNEYGVKVWIRGYTPGMERAAIDYVVDVFNRHLRVQPKHKSSYDSDSQPDEVRIVMPQDSGRKGDVECIIHCLDSHSAETVYQRLKGRLRAGYSEQLKRDPRLNLEMERVGWEESDIR